MPFSSDSPSLLPNNRFTLLSSSTGFCKAPLKIINPNCHPANTILNTIPSFYSRCVKLLSNIERCVVYGRPRSMELQRLYEKGKITKKEYDILEHADRRFNAFQITGDSRCLRTRRICQFGGSLLYKRKVRRGALKFKGWKTRYFVIEEVMLNCYNTKGGTLVRSMPLEGATITSIENGKYPNMFSVKNRRFEFVMRATSMRKSNGGLIIWRKNRKAHVLFGNPDVQAKRRRRFQTFATRGRLDALATFSV